MHMRWGATGVTCVCSTGRPMKLTDTSCGRVYMMQVLLDGTRWYNRRPHDAAILLLVQYIQLYDCTELVVAPLDHPVAHGLPVHEHNGGHLLDWHPVSIKCMARHNCMHDNTRGTQLVDGTQYMVSLLHTPGGDRM